MHQIELETENMQLEEFQIYEKLVHKLGSSISEAALDSQCIFFNTPEIEGIIGYRINHECAIVLGDPICTNENKAPLALAFQKFCSSKNLTVIYFIVSQSFAKWAIHHGSKIMIHIGEEIVFDPTFDPIEGHKGVKLRNAIHHAQHLGLTVKEYIPLDPEIENSIINVGKTWVEARKGPQIYLGNLNFFQNRTNKRWFYLQDDKQKFIGMAVLGKLEAHKGWLLKFLITIPDVPRGASELLMIKIIETLRSENCRYLTYGMVPADSIGEIIGLGTFGAWTAKKVFGLAKWIFHLDKRKIYWHKFHPNAENTYMLLSSPSIGLKEMRALGKAMKMDFRK